MTDLTNLLNQKQELDKQISLIQSEVKKTALADIVSQMRNAGLTIQEVSRAFLSKSKRVNGLPMQRTGKPMTNGTTIWNGLGRRPAWVNEAEAAGTLKPVENND